MKVIKKIFLIGGILVILLSLPDLETTLRSGEIGEILATIFLLGLAGYMIYEGLRKEKEEDAYTELFIKMFLESLSPTPYLKDFILRSEIYQDLIGRLQRIEENQKTIIKILEDNDS